MLMVPHGQAGMLAEGFLVEVHNYRFSAHAPKAFISVPSTQLAQAGIGLGCRGKPSRTEILIFFGLLGGGKCPPGDSKMICCRNLSDFGAFSGKGLGDEMSKLWCGSAGRKLVLCSLWGQIEPERFECGICCRPGFATGSVGPLPILCQSGGRTNIQLRSPGRSPFCRTPHGSTTR